MGHVSGMIHAPSPIECFRQMFEAWKDRDWDQMDELAQPSWRQGIKDAPGKQEKILMRWIHQNGFKPLPLTRLDPRTELRKLRKWIRNRDVGVPRDRIRYLLDGLEPIEVLVEPRTKEIHLTGVKKGEIHIDKNKMIDVRVRVLARLLGDDRGADRGGRPVIWEKEIQMTARVMDEGGGWTYNPVSLLKRSA